MKDTVAYAKAIPEIEIITEIPPHEVVLTNPHKHTVKKKTVSLFDLFRKRLWFATSSLRSNRVSQDSYRHVSNTDNSDLV